MIRFNVTKNKICLEDIEFGVGTVEQTRGNEELTLNKINASNMPYDGTSTLAEKIAYIESVYEYMQSMEATIVNAANVENLLQALSVNIDELAAWLVNGNVLGAFQPYTQTVVGVNYLADNLNYTMLDSTVIDPGATINLGTNTELYIVKGEDAGL